jgi:hypothetical protein
MRGAANGVEQRAAALVRGGDVEQDDFVGAFRAWRCGERGGIAGVDEVDELDAFDDAAVADVEAGDDAFGQHWREFSLRPHLQKIAEDFQAGFAGFFRMKLHAHHVARSTARRRARCSW